MSGLTACPGTAAAAPNTARGSELCVQCGLCCTGALHNFAVLQPDETDFARELGLTLRTDGRPGFALPCRWLKGSACSIYDRNRPRVCGSYKCQLLLDLEQDATTFDRSVAKVRTAKMLFEQAQECMPEGLTFPEARAQHAGPPRADEGSSERQSEMKLRLAVTAVTLYLDRNFKHGREGRMLSMVPLGQEDAATP